MSRLAYAWRSRDNYVGLRSHDSSLLVGEVLKKLLDEIFLIDRALGGRI